MPTLPARLAALWRRYPLISGSIVALFVVAAIFAPIVSPADPYQQSLRERFVPPMWMERGTAAHPLGTDQLGRDLLSRIIYGARISLAVGVLTVLIATVIGAAVGLVAGYYGGKVDSVLTQLTDATLSMPTILLALILAVTVGPSFGNVVAAIACILWARYARIIRGEVMSLMRRDFIDQARLAGCSSLRIMLVHLAPNIANTLIVLFTLQVGYVIIVEASLSFLGAGIPPPRPTWGAMIAGGRDFTVRAWWIAFFPGLAVCLIVLAFNALGDWVRDRLDPKFGQL